MKEGDLIYNELYDSDKLWSCGSFFWEMDELYRLVSGQEYGMAWHIRPTRVQAASSEYRPCWSSTQGSTGVSRPQSARSSFRDLSDFEPTPG